MRDADLGNALLALARAALDRAFGDDVQADVAHPSLARPGATFVTLTQCGELRGCIGTLEAHRTLREDVEHNARNAAFRDPRFAPLAAAERAITRIEVSLLSVPVPLAVRGEDDLLRQLRPGEDGVVLSCGERRATFLPQVWDALPEPRAFVAALKQKAGLSPRFWNDDIRVARYAVDKYREPAPADRATA